MILNGILAALLLLVAQPQPGVTYVALRSTTDYPPHPVDGVVTLTLASGAWIKIRAGDIDYDLTSAYLRLVVVRPQTATAMTAKDSGRKYWNLTFGNRFVATAWDEDVDTGEVRNIFPGYYAWLRAQSGMTLANFQRLAEGSTLSMATVLLGRDGVLKSSSSIGEYTAEMYEWRDGDKFVTALFQNGKLASKAQYGLR